MTETVKAKDIPHGELAIWDGRAYVCTRSGLDGLVRPRFRLLGVKSPEIEAAPTLEVLPVHKGACAPGAVARKVGTLETGEPFWSSREQRHAYTVVAVGERKVGCVSDSARIFSNFDFDQFVYVRPGCIECEHLGYFPSHSDSYGWSLEACDTCRTFDDDDDALQVALDDLATVWEAVASIIKTHRQNEADALAFAKENRS